MGGDALWLAAEDAQRSVGGDTQRCDLPDLLRAPSVDALTRIRARLCAYVSGSAPNALLPKHTDCMLVATPCFNASDVIVQ